MIKIFKIILPHLWEQISHHIRLERVWEKTLPEAVYEKLGKDTFKKMIEIPPNTRELKDPQLYLKKMSQ